MSSEPLIGTLLGPYRIQRVLGKGGMGVVCLAVRDDSTFEKQVAVKVVKPGMDSAAVLDRFNHERRILANLDHPYISRLLDAGTTPDGRPYFVMEYVEGQPILEYCSNHRVDLRAKLELFRKVCDAVSFAHRKLVVHRDLKASNILVTADGSPTLLDFGIAKLLDPHSQSADTEPANRMLTLSCASPEQVRGETVTTATDIYSLGLLLFELLTGRPAWVFDDIPVAQAEQIICGSAAPKPSTVRGARVLSGDLDNIVLMALRKDPARRYRSVDEFSEDIRRHQIGLPVIARQDSFTYRTAKLIRRHWVAAALASTAAAALTGGIVYANVERHRAEARLAEILGLANETLLDLQAQIERQPGSTETRMKLTKSTLEYLAGVAKDSGNNQAVRSTLAKAYVATGDIQGYPDGPNLGDSKGALASYQAAEALFGPGDVVPRARMLWHRGVILFKLGQVAEGLTMLRRAAQEASKTNSHEATIIQAGAYHSIAYAITPSNPEEGLANSRQEMDLFSKLVEREPGNVEALNGLAESYFSVGGALVRRNKVAEALEVYRKSAAILEPLLVRQPNDIQISRDLLNIYIRIGDSLGNPARRNLGDMKGALPYFHKALALAQSHAKADPNNHLAQQDLMEAIWRVGVVMDAPDEAKASLDILDDAWNRCIAMSVGKAMPTAILRAVATIDEYRAKRLAVLKDANLSMAAYQRAKEEARAIIAKDANDSGAWTILLRIDGRLPVVLASLGRRDEALKLARDANAMAIRLEAAGPDRVSMAVYIPRTSMRLGETYETLAGKESGLQKAADLKAARENYSRAAEEWQKLHGRADFSWYQGEVSECARRIAECSRLLNSQR